MRMVCAHGKRRNEPINLSVDPALVAEARLYGLNLSPIAEEDRRLQARLADPSGPVRRG